MTGTRMTVTRVAATLVAALLAVGLAGCGGTGEAAPTTDQGRADAGFNATDVMFLQMMVPHHRQGIAIVRLAKDRSVRAEVTRLSEAIAKTQDTEIRSMTGWLRSWGQPATAHPDAHASHGGMPSTDQAAITAVGNASDAEFERAFLNLLIAHQDDAIQLARRELSHGRDRGTLRLARQIERSRAAQIKAMLGLLGQQ